MSSSPSVQEEPRRLTESAPRPLVSVAEFATSQNDIDEFAQTCMIRGVDYGVIGEFGGRTLFKPGAEKLLSWFGLATKIEMTSRYEDWTPGKALVAYEIKIVLINKRNGQFAGEGIGSCSSRERRYAKQDAAAVANTVLKMAKKRALVDATVTATRTSGLFAQEEDIDERPARRNDRGDNRRDNSRGNTNRHSDVSRETRPPQRQAPQPELASRDLLQRTENVRLRAVELGYRSESGNEPAPVPAGRTRAEAEQKLARWGAYVANHTPPAVEEVPGSDEEAGTAGEEGATSDEPTYQIPTWLKPLNCTSCGREIFFVKTEGGKNMPVQREGKSRVGVAHWAHCPGADSHRKRSTPTPAPAMAPDEAAPKKESPLHLKRLFAVIAKKGLSTGKESRDARIRAVNAILTAKGKSLIASSNDIPLGAVDILIQAIESGELTW